MTSLENVKHKLIDHILTIQNEEFLKAIITIFDFANLEERVTLSPEQIEMLRMAQEDIANGRLISDEDLKASDPDWLK
jgi:hypothetical protein